MSEHDGDCDIYRVRVCTCGKLLRDARDGKVSVDLNTHECRLELLAAIDRVGADVRHNVAKMCADQAELVKK